MTRVGETRKLANSEYVSWVALIEIVHMLGIGSKAQNRNQYEWLLNIILITLMSPIYYLDFIQN